MGMLNIGEQIFSMLLPGLNNVTGRIRYYSFYCWFFGWYAKSIGSESPQEQRKYLRRAEYLLALVGARNNHLGDQDAPKAGVSGITEAEKQFNENDSSFSLQEGTGELKGTTEGSYWKNPRGVFGQNYVSSLRQIALIRDKGNDTGVYIRTAFEKENVVSGKDLEESFNDNLSDLSKSTFEKAVLEGRITQGELTIISKDFNMLSIPEGTLENTLLLNMLTGSDHPTTDLESQLFRRKTIIHYLNLLQTKKEMVSVQDFANHAYSTFGLINNTQDDTLMAWYYYQLSQYWHVVSTSCLMNVLVALQEKSDSGWYVESELVNELTKEVVEELNEYLPEASSSLFKELDILDHDNSIITQKIHSSNYQEGLAYGFLLLKKLLHENKEFIEIQFKLAKKYNLHSTSDFVAVYKDLEEKSNLSITDFVSYFLRKYILNRHQLVALNKMNATQSTEKFLREDGLIRLIELIDFDYSSPRLGNVLQFLKDLNIVNNNGSEITTRGTQFQKEIQQ